MSKDVVWDIDMIAREKLPLPSDIKPPIFTQPVWYSGQLYKVEYKKDYVVSKKGGKISPLCIGWSLIDIEPD